MLSKDILSIIVKYTDIFSFSNLLKTCKQYHKHIYLLKYFYDINNYKLNDHINMEELKSCSIKKVKNCLKHILSLKDINKQQDTKKIIVCDKLVSINDKYIEKFNKQTLSLFAECPLCVVESINNFVECVLFYIETIILAHDMYFSNIKNIIFNIYDYKIIIPVCNNFPTVKHNLVFNMHYFPIYEKYNNKIIKYGAIVCISSAIFYGLYKLIFNKNK